ncbi:MAG: DUF4838 domain-containing protein [Kiritimatiellae bacterium]|nr:DUF4838 domain-containing protein [Kiritimatiellia bacterium]
MNIRYTKNVCLACAALILAGWSESWAASDAVTLAENGATRAAVVANGHAAQAAVLTNYLSRIAGAPFPLVESADAVPEGHAAVVLAVADVIPGIGGRAAAMQGYRIHTENGRLHLTGRSEQGLTYAVYGLLDDHLGVRFYAPDAEVIPVRAGLVLGPLDDRQEPAFLGRSFSRPFGHPLAGLEPLYNIKNRAGTPRIIGNHNFYTWISPTNFTAHPEWFPLINGERRTDPSMPLCASNKELADTLAGRFMEQMDRMARGDRKGLIGAPDPFAGFPAIFSVAQGDGFRLCECSACRALAEREASEAAPYILLLNRALERTAAKFPTNPIVTFAYYGTLKPPKTLRPHSNLWINIVSSSLSPYPAGDQLGPIRDNPHNRDYAAAIRGWPQIAPGRVTIWDWTGNFTDATVEWPNILNVADNIRFFRENNIESVFLEQPAGEQNWGWLRKWVWARMLWKPAHDPLALMREFIFGYYGGKAGPFIWEYHRMVDRGARASGYASATVRWTCYQNIIRQKLFPDEMLSAMSALLEGALNAAAEEENPLYAERVRQALGTSVDTLLLVGAGQPAPTLDLRDGSRWMVPGGRPDCPARIDRVADAWLKTTAAGAESWHFRYRFLQRTGGKLQRLANENFTLETLPAVNGQIYSLVHTASGKELLAPGDTMQVGGYVDRLPGATTTVGWQEDDYHRRWIGAASNAVADTQSLFGLPITSPWISPQWLQRQGQRFQLCRDLVLKPGDDALRVRRRYLGRRIGPATQVFEASWSFAVADPSRATLTVREGEAEHVFNLGKMAVTASVARVADKPVSLTDVTVQDFDFVEGKALTLTLRGGAGNVVIALARGDGLTVELTTPAASNRTVSLTPVLAEKRVSVAIGSVPWPLPADADAEVALPEQTLRVMGNLAEPAGQIKIATNRQDGAEMVWIPHGHFLMGSPYGQGAADESPQRRILLDGYWIYKFPVTVAQYRAFCGATGRTMPALSKGSDGDDRPMINVSWHDAAAYAAWAGAALPTEAQWEKAARGTDGRTYPWGNDWDPNRCASMENTHGAMRYRTPAVGSYPSGASPYGAMDMAGLVWEWVADWYAPNAYRTMFAANPTGPDRGSHKVLRGGSYNWDEWYSRVSARHINPPDAIGLVCTGFRCVRPEP